MGHGSRLEPLLAIGPRQPEAAPAGALAGQDPQLPFAGPLKALEDLGNHDSKPSASFEFLSVHSAVCWPRLCATADDI